MICRRCQGGKGTYLVQLDDVRVANYLQNVDFPGDSLNVRLVLDLVLLQDLDGHLLTGDEMGT